MFRALRKLWDRALRVPLHDDAQVLKATRQVRIYCYPPLPDLPHPLVVTNRSTWDEEFKKLDLQAVWKAETEVCYAASHEVRHPPHPPPPPRVAALIAAELPVGVRSRAIFRSPSLQWKGASGLVGP